MIPIAANRRSCAGPTPGSSRTGAGASTPAASAPSTAKPRGLSRPAAILASSRLAASPIETVMPTSLSISRASRASTTAGGAPCSAAVPERSSTASSIESGWTSGVSRSISRRTWREAAEYFEKSGGITTASGHRRRARNIGMALRTPDSRAT